MKPTQIFEMTTTPTEFLQTQVKGKTKGRKIVYVVAGFVSFVLVVVAVLLSVHFGMEMAKDTQKEYQATIARDVGTVIKEIIIVTETEEVFVNDAFTGIADFTKITFEPKNMIRRTYEVMNVWLTNKALGDTSAELCNGQTAFFLRELTDRNARKKRAMTGDIGLLIDDSGSIRDEFASGNFILWTNHVNYSWHI